MKRSRLTEEQIGGIQREQEAGMKTADVCRKHGGSGATFDAWKAKYGVMDVSEAKLKADRGLGLLVRSFVGLDRDAAKNAFADFMGGKSLNANQSEFLNLIIDCLTEQGAMDPDACMKARPPISTIKASAASSRKPMCSGSWRS